MKLHDKKRFYQSKGFYISCFLGFFAILSVVTIQKNMEQQKAADLQEEQNAVELSKNETDEQSDTDNGHTFDNVNNDPQQEPKDIADASAKETPAPTEATSSTEKAVPKSDSAITSAKETKAPDEEDASVAVINTDESNQGLTWPINGDIILNYSMDKSVYFSTLGQYKCNPALILSGKKGDKVVSASDCTVTNVTRNEETGLTVTTTAKNYKFIYGQLADLKVSKGDTIREGTVIGTLAEPTKFYTEEGCNLYFQVLENGKSINPLLLLK